jgi:hypothetical protein
LLSPNPCTPIALRLGGNSNRSTGRALSITLVLRDSPLE